MEAPFAAFHVTGLLLHRLHMEDSPEKRRLAAAAATATAKRNRVANGAADALKAAPGRPLQRLSGGTAHRISTTPNALRRPVVHSYKLASKVFLAHQIL